MTSDDSLVLKIERSTLIVIDIVFVSLPQTLINGTSCVQNFFTEDKVLQNEEEKLSMIFLSAESAIVN